MSAVETLLRREWTRLFGYALRLTGNHDAAADLLQTTAAKALAYSPQHPATISGRAWIFATLRNAWIDDFRRAAIRSTELPAPDFSDAWNFDDAIIAGITVRQALARLEAPYREVIELVDMQGFRYAEAAVMLKVPIGTVMSRLSRARLLLLAQIEGNALRPNRSAERHVQRG